MTIALLLIAWHGDLYSQTPQTATPAVKKWLEGLDARKDGLDSLMAKLKAFANGPNGGTPGAVPRSIGCPVALESALVAALTDAHIIDAGTKSSILSFTARGRRIPGRVI
jgi:hypothetical protein